MWLLHQRSADDGAGPAGRESRSDEGGGEGLDGREPLSVHRLLQDHRCGVGRGRPRGGRARTDAGEGVMSTIEAPPTRPTSIVGQRVLRSEGRGLRSGRGKNIAHPAPPGMLILEGKLAPYANARILRIGTTPAEALPG